MRGHPRILQKNRNTIILDAFGAFWRGFATPKEPLYLYYVTQYEFKVPVKEILYRHKVFLMSLTVFYNRDNRLNG